MGGLSMLLFWGVIIVALVVLVKWLAGGTAARGEIGKDEFEQKKRDPGGDMNPAAVSSNVAGRTGWSPA